MKWSFPKDLATLTPLELRAQLLDAVERSLRSFRGRTLPFNRIAVHILAHNPAAHTVLVAAITDLKPDFGAAVRGRLKESGLALPPRFLVRHELHDKAPERFAPLFEQHGPVYVETEETAPPSRRAMLRIAQGRAEQESYPLDAGRRYHIGRLRQVADARGRIFRRNDIVFLDPATSDLSAADAAVNETVSREHAAIAFDDAEGRFVWLNEQGSTSMHRSAYPRPLRIGRQPVPLEDGDELYLGQAHIVFSLDPDDASAA